MFGQRNQETTRMPSPTKNRAMTKWTIWGWNVAMLGMVEGYRRQATGDRRQASERKNG